VLGLNRACSSDKGSVWWSARNAPHRSGTWFADLREHESKRNVKDKRPVNLDISTIKLPLAALTSITHRVSGVIVFVGIALLLCLFDMSLADAEGFAEVQALGANPLFRVLVWALLSALAYHMVAGVKHLVLDLGIGETKEGGPLGAKLVVVISVVLIVLLGVWVW
jgi:succinate dehydrogenase / fumarate reductase cytochrome b subunit